LFELIENDIWLFSENGSVIIMGDMNARTGNASEFIENEFHNQNIPLFENY
jgi:endonuclease/exonuclease/phosphatase family metal-dependent hydrolase